MSEYNLGPFRIRPRGEFNSSSNYRFLDLVTYNGSSFICINYDTIDGIGVVGVSPEGQTSSSLYWQCIAHKGEKGDTGDQYSNYISITNGIWDYSQTDKIIIPDEGLDTLTINNIYDGCCGVIITKKDLTLPTNSDYSIDYNFITVDVNQYYMYTFIYGKNIITNNNRYIWNRTVITV